jgi:hypothetical protein
MKPTGGDVEQFLSAVTPARRRDDARVLARMLRELTGWEPELWGTIVGFGRCHYRYAGGTEGDSPVIGFAPRKNATTLYLLDGVAAHRDDLAELGPHSTGSGCLYLRDLAAVDEPRLRSILIRSLAYVEGGGTEAASLTVTG